jgi:hypothetical protein
MDLAIQIVELGLKVRTDILDRLIVDGRTQSFQKEIEHFLDAEFGKRLVELARKKRLDLQFEIGLSVVAQFDLHGKVPQAVNRTAGQVVFRRVCNFGDPAFFVKRLRRLRNFTLPSNRIHTPGASRAFTRTGHSPESIEGAFHHE